MSNSQNIYPETEREPLDSGEYHGVSKIVFYEFLKSIRKYHQALENAEEVLDNCKTVNND